MFAPYVLQLNRTSIKSTCAYLRINELQVHLFNAKLLRTIFNLIKTGMWNYNKVVAFSRHLNRG